MKVPTNLKSLKGKLSYGVCNVSISALRKEPSHTSEMVSQILFGEHFKITDYSSDDTWAKIINAYDKYVGWIHKKQIISIDKKTFEKINKSETFVSTEMQNALIVENENFVIPILAGSHLPLLKNNKFTINQKQYFFKGKMCNLKFNPNRKKIIQTAFQFLNAPYLWGGRSEFGIDCSGFTQLIYKLNGIQISRDASQQVKEGTDLEYVEQAQPGDLAFFDNEIGKITHVGILISTKEILHASGTVHIDDFDLKGICCKQTKAYTHNLRSIRTYF